MTRRSVCFSRAVFGLSVLCWIALRQPGGAAPSSAGGPPFRVSVRQVATDPRLRIELSVTNVSDRPQTFWNATPDCTNERWKTDDPNIRVLDYALDHSKLCMIACQHHVTLRPGETLSKVVTPFLSPRTRLGRRILRFANEQPNWALTTGAPLSAHRKYKPRVYWSPPISLNIRKEWLRQR